MVSLRTCGDGERPRVRAGELAYSDGDTARCCHASDERVGFVRSECDGAGETLRLRVGVGRGEALALQSPVMGKSKQSKQSKTICSDGSHEGQRPPGN